MKLTNEMIEKAKAAIEADEKHEIFAIRTQDVPFEMGRIDHKSLVWIDGEMTDEELDGISATAIDPDNIEKRSAATAAKDTTASTSRSSRARKARWAKILSRSSWRPPDVIAILA